jgi:hypothetical protein
MKKTILTLICITLICAISIAQNQVTAPKIISTIPAFGDYNVDPELNEIIIRFDQDMETGMSILDSKNMPQIMDKPIWIDKRILSIPVKLYPNKLYSLLFNNRRFQNFRNIEGIPLNPDELHFHTKAISFATINKKAYEELLEIFPKMYSYASLKGINWESLLKQNQSQLENSETPIEFALQLVKLLRIAEDPHLWVETEGQRFETCKTKIVENNFNSMKIFPLLQNQKISKSFIAIAGTIDSVGYISLRNWNIDFDSLYLRDWGNSRNPEIAAYDVLYELFKFPNLIIDVRENAGGNETYAKEFASYFISDSVAYEKVISYNEKTDKFDAERIKWLYPNEKSKKYLGNIYVLSGPAVMSSNESFILMMKQIQNTKVIGMITYGSSGNPIPYDLPNGVTIYLPSWQAYTLDGQIIEGNGIKPDIEIVTSKKDFQDKDILFEKVVEMINRID